MKTLIVGLGNPILSDDGIGVKIAYEVEKALASERNRDITITEASVGGLRLMEMMIDFDRAIIIDAIQTNNGAKPGTIYQMTLDDLRSISPTQHSASAHDTSLITAIDMGVKLGYSLPSDIMIFAIEVENVIDFNQNSTEEVTAAIPIVTAAVLKELDSVP